jgi:hypothetical protein
MSFTKDAAVAAARKDFSKRLGVDDSEVEESVEETEFPDMALGAGTKGEMSGQMMTSGWRIQLKAKGKKAEYRANKQQLRLFNYKGQNYRI